MTAAIEVNDRIYPGILKSTAIVICLDGSQKEYFEEASKLKLTPNIDSFKKNGEDLLVNKMVDYINLGAILNKNLREERFKNLKLAN